MDGYEVSRRIRALLGAEAMPIIAVTAHASADERERCLAAGMSACITKPVEPEMLYAESSKWIDPIDRPVPEPGSIHEAPDAGTADAGDLALPSFDPARVERWQRKTPELYRAMLWRFLAGHESAVEGINALLDSGNREDAAARLHRLRGAAGTLGAAHLEAMAHRLEDALNQDGQGGPALRAEFTAEAAKVGSELSVLPISARDAEHKAQAPKRPKITDFLEITARLETLEDLLIAGNTRALDYLPWLDRCTGDGLLDLWRQLARQIEGLDFREALDTLRRIGHRRGLLVVEDP